MHRISRALLACNSAKFRSPFRSFSTQPEADFSTHTDAGVVTETAIEKNNLRGILAEQNLLQYVIDELKDASPEELTDLKAVTSYQTANSKQLRSARFRNICLKYGKNEFDTGHHAVQAAILSERIMLIEKQRKENNGDINSRRSLQIFLDKRRKVLLYLRRTDFDSYARVMHDYNLKEEDLFNRGKLIQPKKPHPKQKKLLESLGLTTKQQIKAAVAQAQSK